MNPYYPAAIQKPGPAGHVYPQKNVVEGAICHSAEGDWSASYSPTDTMIQRGVSWHFSIFKDGRVEQHYPLDASCWHAGSGIENRRLVGIEHEGGGPGNPSEPLTEAQVLASVALVRWIKEQAGWPDFQRLVRLLEHNEVFSTKCPSGRIPWGRYTVAAVQPLPGGEFLPEPVEESDLGKIAADLTYGVKAGRVDLVQHGPSPARSGWTRLVVDYLP